MSQQEWVAEIELALYGKIGNTFERGHLQRIQALAARLQHLEAEKARLQKELDEVLTVMVRHVKRYLGPDWGTPEGAEHQRTFLVMAINHLGGIRNDYAAVGAALASLRARETALRAKLDDAITTILASAMSLAVCPVSEKLIEAVAGDLRDVAVELSALLDPVVSEMSQPPEQD